MPCEYCERERSPAYTLQASIGETDASVEFDFCSRSCLAAWASSTMDYEAFTVSGQPVG